MIQTSIRRATAKKLRSSTTPHERALWRALKELPVSGTHFRRQAPIGPYVVDLFCPAAYLIIELDGGHHNDDETAEQDRARQLWLEREGYRVIRFWNSEIANDLNAVMERIYVELHGGRDAEAAQLKHQRRSKSSAFVLPSSAGGGSASVAHSATRDGVGCAADEQVTPPRPLRTKRRFVQSGRPSPSRGG
jgi:very-short-patch-repair endonuclease